MTKTNVLQMLSKANAVVIAAILAASVAMPFMLVERAQGAPLQNRLIDMSGNLTSEGSGRDGSDAFGQDVTYRVSFDLNSAHANIEGIVIDFCSNSPIVGEACTAPTGFDTNDATLAFTEVTTVLNANWAIDTASSDANTLVIEDATTTGDNLTATTPITFDLGTAAASDGFTNPTTTGTFYARILTYTDDTVASAYASATPGAYTDDGGIALAVANHLTITARVQEVLEFCIGTDDDSITAGLDGGPGARGAADDCSVVAGTDIDLGVVDASNIQRTSDADIGTSGNDGVAMIRTNAIDGATVYYKAEQETGLSNGGAGTLRLAGVDDCGTIAGVNNGCFNSAGGDVTNPTQAAITAGTELFGMTLTNQDESAGGATTDALSCDGNYDGDGSCAGGVATGYAWDPTGVFDTIASSTGPIDDEMVNIEFAATASPTTPTGLYTVTANFVATSQF